MLGGKRKPTPGIPKKKNNKPTDLSSLSHWSNKVVFLVVWSVSTNIALNPIKLH